MKNGKHPGTILNEKLMARKVSQTDFADHIGWARTRVNEIVCGKRAISAESALTLAEALGTTAEFWLLLQMKHDLATARKGHRKRTRI